MGWNMQYKTRSFVIVVHIKNFKNMHIEEEQYKDYKVLAEILMARWEMSSKKGRVCAIAICESADGVYHVHIAAYSSNSTTLATVSKIFGNAHVEPQLAGKKKLKDYLLKEGPFEEKGEKVLYTCGLENIEDGQGARNDIDEINNLIKSGASPKQIFAIDFRWRKYEKMIVNAYKDFMLESAPIEKEMHCEYHYSQKAGSGKTYTYVKLVQEVGKENVYFMNDTLNGGFDSYMESGAPKYLFIDDLKPNEGLSYRQLLNITDKYSSAQTHSRFRNAYNLWTHVIITSIYPIEELYKQMVPEDRRKTDSIDQLLRRFEYIVYHYKDGNEYKEVRLSASEYKCSAQLEDMALRQQIKKMDDVVEGENPLLTFDRLYVQTGEHKHEI